MSSLVLTCFLNRSKQIKSAGPRLNHHPQPEMVLYQLYQLFAGLGGSDPSVSCFWKSSLDSSSCLFSLATCACTFWTSGQAVHLPKASPSSNTRTDAVATPRPWESESKKEDPGSSLHPRLFNPVCKYINSENHLIPSTY